jgi:hypothetical protein
MYFQSDISNAVQTCLTLHNMMVEVRIERLEEEDSDYYEMVYNRTGAVAVGNEQQQQEELPVLITTLRQKLSAVQMEWPDESRYDIIREHIQSMQENWVRLYSRQGHFDLRESIMKQLQ